MCCPLPTILSVSMHGNSMTITSAGASTAEILEHSAVLRCDAMSLVLYSPVLRQKSCFHPHDRPTQGPNPQDVNLSTIFSLLASFITQNSWRIFKTHHLWERGFTAVHCGRGPYLYAGLPGAGSNPGNSKLFGPPPIKGRGPSS